MLFGVIRDDDTDVRLSPVIGDKTEETPATRPRDERQQHREFYAVGECTDEDVKFYCFGPN